MNPLGCFIKRQCVTFLPALSPIPSTQRNLRHIGSIADETGLTFVIVSGSLHQ